MEVFLFLIKKFLILFLKKLACLKKTMNNLIKKKQLNAYKHNSFWQCMDTLRDKNLLEKLWRTGNAKW